MKTTEILCEGNSLIIPRVAGKIKELLQGITPQKIGSNYNGYGYADWYFIYEVPRIIYDDIVNIISSKKEKEKEKKEKKEIDPVEKWAKRLSKLSHIPLDRSIAIAKEKLNYQENQISLLKDRQCERFSRQREKLIKKLERANPLRRIVDEEHAMAILAASHRHNETDYETYLEEGRDLVKLGEIDNAKEYARENYHR